MNIEKRAEMIKAMDTIVSTINDERIIDSWLMCGVADGDITPETTDADLECYCEDDTFKDLMTLFLKLMRRAGNNGGLYCDRIVSAERHDEWR